MGTYKVIFLGLAVIGSEEEARLIAGLKKKFNLSAERAESLLQRVPIVVKKEISKEEMERYVRAFQEIGGKVSVEEEITAEPLEIMKEAISEKKPDMEGMIICPQCGFKQPETDQCINCGIIISRFLKYQEKASSWDSQAEEASSEKEYPPWESGEEAIGAFFQTAREALFSPTQFFKKAAQAEGYWPPLIYGLICGIIGFGGTIFWQWFIVSRWIPFHRYTALPYSFFLTVISIALPFIVAFKILIESNVAHLCLMIVGGNKNGFQVTFRTVSYSFTGQLFGIIPFIGIAIGNLYALILVIIGVREGHQISTGRAVIAIFFPILVMVGLAIIVIFFLMFFGSMGLFSGVGV